MSIVINCNVQSFLMKWIITSRKKSSFVKYETILWHDPTEMASAWLSRYILM